MAKQRRTVKTPAKPIRRVKRTHSTKKNTRKAVAANSRPHIATERAEAALPSAAAPPEPLPPAPPRKPGFYEAVAIYERGVQALQKHDFAGAASFFRTVLERYPEERELLERARLYLRVCERETSRQPAPAPRLLRSVCMPQRWR